MGRRTWIKLQVDGWLRGSIRQEEYPVRSVFTDLLAMAGDSAFGDDGVIMLAEGVGFTDEVISGILNTPLKVWLDAKERLENHPKRGENRIKMLPCKIGYCIKILKWKQYQSEYIRTKKYKKSTEEVQKISHREREGDRDIEGERDKEREENKRLKDEEAPQFHHLLEGFQFFEKEKTIPRALIENLLEKFGTQTVLDELFAANNWLLANPNKRKTNLGQFISNWFKKVQPLQDVNEGINLKDPIVCRFGHNYHKSNRNCPECEEIKIMHNVDDYTPESRTVIGLDTTK